MRRALALLAALAAAAQLAGCGGGGLGGDAPQELLPAAKREPAPAFSVRALEGDGRVSLAAHEGRPVILSFWASWCEPCQRETPQLEAFSKEHPGLDVVGLAVNDATGDARRFAAKEGMSYTLGLDPDADVASDYGVHGLPVTAVIDAQGRLAATFIGEIDAAQLDSFAEQLGA